MSVVMQRFRYDDAIVRRFLLATFVWGFVGMLVGLIVGVAIGVLQALTQIQESTLVFVPKILSIFAAVVLLLPLMAAAMSGLMSSIVQRIVVP